MADTKRTKVGKEEQPRTLDEVLAGLLLIAGPALIARLMERPRVNPPTRDPKDFDTDEIAAAYEAGRRAAKRTCSKCMPCTKCGRAWPEHADDDAGHLS